jgi:hypothetical protein
VAVSADSYDASNSMKWTGLVFPEKPEYMLYWDGQVGQTANLKVVAYTERATMLSGDRMANPVKMKGIGVKP